MKNSTFWDVTPCGSCKNRRIGGTYFLFLRGVLRLLDTAYVVLSSPILVTLMMEATQEPHGVISQKTVFLIVTAVETSNLTREPSSMPG
jgi:hypothetical protein